MMGMERGAAMVQVLKRHECVVQSVALSWPKDEARAHYNASIEGRTLTDLCRDWNESKYDACRTDEALRQYADEYAAVTGEVVGEMMRRQDSVLSGVLGNALGLSRGIGEVYGIYQGGSVARVLMRWSGAAEWANEEGITHDGVVLVDDRGNGEWMVMLWAEEGASGYALRFRASFRTELDALLALYACQSRVEMVGYRLNGNAVERAFPQYVEVV